MAADTCVIGWLFGPCTRFCSKWWSTQFEEQAILPIAKIEFPNPGTNNIFSSILPTFTHFGWFSRWSKKKVVSWSEFESPNQCFLSRVMSLSSNFLSILFRSIYEFEFSYQCFLSHVMNYCTRAIIKKFWKNLHIMLCMYNTEYIPNVYSNFFKYKYNQFNLVEILSLH